MISLSLNWSLRSNSTSEERQLDMIIHCLLRYILPVCLPPKDLRLEGKKGFVTGWGRIYEGGPKPPKLTEV